MTQDEIIEMATEAGLCCARNGFIDWIDAGPSLHEIALFAKLVAAKEREACAKVCEYESGDGPDNGCCPTYWNEAQEACAKAIRARGEA